MNKNTTLKEFLKEKGIMQHNIKSIGIRTLKYILKGKHDWQSNDNYRWRLPYFPTERTLSKLCLELEISYIDLVKLIENQHKSNKSIAKKER